MNDLVRQALKQLLASHGHSLARDSRRCEAWLCDLCPEERKHIHVLIQAMKVGAVNDLVAGNTGIPTDVLIRRLSKKLHDDSGISEDLAQWAVETWALALGILNETETAEAQPQQERVETERLQNEAAARAKATNLMRWEASGDPVKWIEVRNGQWDHAMWLSLLDGLRTSSYWPMDESGVGAILDRLKRDYLARRPPPPAPARAELIVAADGSGDCRTLGEAVRRVNPGQRVLVRSGTYAERVTLEKSVEIIGDGPLAGIIIQAPDGLCVYVKGGESVIRGITMRGIGGSSDKKFPTVYVTQGQITLENCDVSRDAFKGIYVSGSGAKAIIRRCIIHDCKEVGVMIIDSATATLEDCEIHSNGWSGVEAKQRSRVVLRSCVVRDGKSDGVTVSKGSNATVEKCQIVGNKQDGIVIADSSAATVRGCGLHRNGKNGVFIWWSSTGTVEECEIRGNNGSGVILGQHAPQLTIRKCKINGNNQHAVMVAEGGKATVLECDVTGNKAGSWNVTEVSFMERMLGTKVGEIIRRNNRE